MDLLMPEMGTVVWMLIAFLTVFFLLKKLAWKPILNALKDRDASIEKALQSAEKAREDMAKLEANNEKIIAEAKQERDKILKEAKDIKNSIIEEAKTKASDEGAKIIESAKAAVKSEKEAAMKEIKEQVANLSVLIAEKVLAEKMGDTDANKQLIDKYLNEIKVN